ncbi:hypothetical protein B0H14DRAFT_3483623 [Mycena olivaceomarginata]|nr:hypothetical protein B0H14DRAFT_3483623 [Mycena olivaceomarginata]
MLAVATRGPTEASSRKRARTTSDVGRDNDDMPPPDAFSSPISGVVNRNAATVVKNYAKKLKIRGEPLTQLDTFLNDTQSVREGKLFCLLLAVSADIANIVAAAPAFAVSAELKLNIQRYAIAIFLSPKLGMYRGDVPIQHVMDIIKKHCFNLPPGIENSPADMAKIEKAIQDVFTQGRSTFKKKLFASVRVWRMTEGGDKIAVDLPAAEHQNLFGLAQAFVDGTKCRITSALCGRIALMRSFYLENSGQTFWTELDKALICMRETANGSAETVDEMFEELITEDKALHGAIDIVYQTINDIQQEVDDLIDASAANVASTPAADLDSASSSEQPEGSGAASGSGERSPEKYQSAYGNKLALLERHRQAGYESTLFDSFQVPPRIPTYDIRPPREDAVRLVLLLGEHMSY